LISRPRRVPPAARSSVNTPGVDLAGRLRPRRLGAESEISSLVAPPPQGWLGAGLRDTVVRPGLPSFPSVSLSGGIDL
jgi:hypothetical protein